MLRRAVASTLMVVVAVSFAALLTAGSQASRPGRRGDCHAGVPPLIHDGFPEPPLRYSHNGLLDTRLRASVSRVRINHHSVLAMNYDGSVPGPTLVICAGDRVIVHLENDLKEPTNLHTHGFHVSPSGNHDNVFVKVDPGQSFTYEYNIPQDMSPGSYWYHPHLHMHVEAQVFGGLAGAIVEEGGLDRLPALRKIPQRWIVLQNPEIQKGKVVPVALASEAQSQLHVNGVVDPTAKIHPGELQRWRIFNADADRIVVLRLPRKQHFLVLAEDGQTLARARSVSSLLMVPGSRRDVLVRGGPAGSYALKAAPFSQFPGGDKAADGGPVPNQTVLTLRSSGAGARMKFSPRTVLSHPVDLRPQHIDRKRTIIFSEMTSESGIPSFLLNGMTFDPNRTDVTMKLGSIEQWTLVNSTEEWHTFHIHTDDFQVVSVKGKAVPYIDYEDNVALPPYSHTVVLIHPTDFTGRFVFHCHITFHEDHGMMATVEVVKEPTPAQLQASVVHDGGLAISSSAYGSRASPPAIRALLLICHALAVEADRHSGRGLRGRAVRDRAATV